MAVSSLSSSDSDVPVGDGDCWWKPRGWSLQSLPRQSQGVETLPHVPSQENRSAVKEE